MADLVEIAQWEEGVYQLETSDPVMGGPDGVDNRQAKQLANRTRYLRAQQEAHAGAENPHPQYATLVAMQAALAALVNSSPATLDTLKELADALGDDPDFATTVTNLLALKAALDSPFFTGTPRGPTPAQFDNSTKLATTAFLSQFGLQYSPLHSGQATVASTTMDNSYIGSRVVFNNTANQTATLPPIAGLPNGASVHCSKVSTSSSGIVTISAAGADQIDSGTGLVTSVALNPGEDCIFTVLSGAWVISGSFLFRRNAFSQSLANNGYAKLPSGLIVQWGTSTIATQSMQTVTLPVAYPNAFILAAGNTGTVITPNAASISLGFQGKALERLQSAARQASAEGKAKVTKKALEKSVERKISAAHAKQLLQALQSVLHDPVFGKLSPGTIAVVHAALAPHADMLDAISTRRHRHPVHTPNENGVFVKCETIRAPMTKRTGLSPAEIHLAQPEEGKWIYSTTLRVGNGTTSGLPSMRDFTSIYPTRMQAVRAAVSDFTRALDRADRTRAKEAPAVRAWLDRLSTMPDPDWTENMATEVAK